MERIVAFFFFCMCAVAGASAQSCADYAVVPLPQTIEQAAGDAFVLTSGVTVSFPAANEDMRRNADFLVRYVAEATGINLTIASRKQSDGIRLVIDKNIKGDEAYTLKVNAKGIIIAGSTARGVFYGIQTLRKSLPTGAHSTVDMPAVNITDSPRFVHRGMMLDCARHFFNLDFVKRYIDLIAMHNMNVFHWHLSDDQGWRIEIKKYPDLVNIGSKRTGTTIGFNTMLDDSIPYGGYYTQEQAREIVEYARQRYITVIPEIDMPGHMLAAMTAYPHLGCTGGPYEVAHRWGVSEEVLCLGNEKVYGFCEDVLDEIMDIFPSKRIHIGGDETPTVSWEHCPECRKVAEDNNLTFNKLQGFFTERIEKYVNSKGRTIVGWDELLDGTVTQSATIQSWRDAEHGRIAAEAGHDVIMSPTSHCYFDYNQAEADKAKYEPTLCGGFVSVEKVYGFEPCAANLSEKARPHIIGVQANVWTEYLWYPNQVEYQVLPRMAALSEVQWTSGKKDFDAFRTRLVRLRSLYDVYHLTYARHLWPETIVSPWKFDF